MLVLVTGGTGFVGAHTVEAVTRAGHQARVLAREPAAVETALAPLEVAGDAVEVLLGDVTDRAAVTRAVRGSDAVVHAAAVYSFDSRRRGQTRRTNVRGTELVLAAARRFGVGRVVYVSTFGALEPGAGGIVGPDSPPARVRETYLASKAAAEAIARQHQIEGTPVAITYPPALLGPHDPKLGDQSTRLRNMLRGLMPVWPTGGFPIGDVRDTAQLHAALLTAPAQGSDRYLAPGSYVTTRQYVQALREVTGRTLPTAFLPARPMLPFAYATDLLQLVWPWHIPAEYGACLVCARDARPEHADSLGLNARPLAQTLTDTVRWMRQTGLLSASQAGALASTGLDATRAGVAR